MTRLTRAKQLTRMSAVALAGVVVLLIVGRIGFNILNNYTATRQQKTVVLRADVALGPLPTPVLTTPEVTVSTTNIRLDLVDGALPQASASATVFKVGKPTLSLSAQDRARARATKLGFTSKPTQPTPSTFRWIEGSRTLTIDLEDQNFSLTTNLSVTNVNGRLAFSKFDPLSSRVSQFVKSQFTFLDLQNDTPTSQFVLPTATIFQPQNPNIDTPSGFLQATVRRIDVNGLPIYSAHGKFGPISLEAIPAKKTDKPSSSFYLDQVIQLRSDYQTIDQSSKGTYPVITAQAAYDKLKAGFSDYLVSVLPYGSANPTTLSSINVQFATLVYLEPDSQNRKFVQPVWMFEGRGNTNAGTANWVAYVPAVNFTKTQELINASK